MRRIVTFGATSAIAEECLRKWATQEPTHFVLVGRYADRLKQIADDLRVRNAQSEVTVVTGGFAGVEEVVATVDDALSGGPADIALIAFGSLPDQAKLTGDAQAFVDTQLVNGVWPSLFAQVLFERSRDAGYGKLVLIGSVAGDRGRRSNYTYGSAKALVAAVASGLRHTAHGSGVQVSLVKPGPTDTPMTRHADFPGKLASPVAVADAIVKGVDSGKAVIYAPALWRIVMTVIRALPDAVFNRLNI